MNGDMILSEGLESNGRHFGHKNAKLSDEVLCSHAKARFKVPNKIVRHILKVMGSVHDFIEGVRANGTVVWSVKREKERWVTKLAMQH